MVLRNRIEVEVLEAVVHEDGLGEGQSCLVYAIHIYPVMERKLITYPVDDVALPYLATPT